MKISFKQLEVLVAIGKYGTMGLAAEKLYMTQSACSMALSTLEARLGRKLFDRCGKRLILNDYGTDLLPKAVNILTQGEEFQTLIDEKNSTALFGQIIIGASTTIGSYVLPDLIVGFSRKHPNVKIVLQVSNTEHIIQQLLKFNLDFGMIEGICHSPKISVLPWKKDELVIVVSPSHPLCKKKIISLEDIFQEKWVLREEGSGTRAALEKKLAEKIYPFLELGHTEAIKKVVLQGLGITCLSRASVDDLLKNKKLIEISVPFLKLTRDFSIICHKEKNNGTLPNQFLKSIQAVP